MKELFLVLAFGMPGSEAIIAAIWEILTLWSVVWLKDPSDPHLYLRFRASVLKDRSFHKKDAGDQCWQVCKPNICTSEGIWSLAFREAL